MTVETADPPAGGEARAYRAAPQAPLADLLMDAQALHIDHGRLANRLHRVRGLVQEAVRDWERRVAKIEGEVREARKALMRAADVVARVDALTARLEALEARGPQEEAAEPLERSAA